MTETNGLKKDVVSMAEENGNDIGLIEEDYQPSIKRKEEFYGNLLKFPACRKLWEYGLKEQNPERIRIRPEMKKGDEIDRTKITKDIPLLRITGKFGKPWAGSRNQSLLLGKTYIYLTRFVSLGVASDKVKEIGIIDEDIGIESHPYAYLRLRVPFHDDDGSCWLYSDDLFPIFIDGYTIKIDSKKVLASTQLMKVFEFLMEEISEALSIITVKDSFKIDSNDTQLTDVESEILEAQKNLIASLEKR